MRHIQYTYDATYYYSMISYVFCLLLAMGLSAMARSGMSRTFKNVIVRGVLVVAVVLIAVNFVKVRQTLAETWPLRSYYATVTFEYGSMLKPHSKRYCLAGSDNTIQLGTMSLPLWDYFCWPRDAREAVYLTRQRDNSLWLSKIRRRPLGPDTKKIELNPGDTYLLSRDVYDSPDMALKVERGFHGGVVMGYRGPGDDAMFMMRGSIIYPHKLKGGVPIDDVYLAAVPHLRPWSNVEVRHSRNGVYLFVDDYVLASMDREGEQPGRAGIYLVKEGLQRAIFTDFVAAPSAAGGSFSFIPVLMLADKVPEVPRAQ